jgi:2-(1,2-epoxy-1,2-dihydrophenyl)acetyl-CoA isomerase
MESSTEEGVREMSDEIILEKKGPVAIITLNRPDDLNACTPSMVRDLYAAFDEIKEDPDIRVFITTGAGRGYCTGANLKDDSIRVVVTEGIEEEAREDFTKGAATRTMPAEWGFKIWEMDKPSIAAVNGPASAGGLGLALMSDITIASERAVFIERYIKLGTVPSNGCWFLPKLVGLKKAYELLLLGEPIDAREAERIGLVNKVVPHDDLMDEAEEWAMKLANRPPNAVKYLKQAVRRGLEGENLEENLWFISLARGLPLVIREMEEGWRAFQEKREERYL